MDAITQPRVQPATIEDLPELVELLMELFEEEEDFEPNREKQERGLRLILEEPKRGRIYIMRTPHKIIGMVNLLFTISTASGGFVILLEDFVIRAEHRGQGYGSRLIDHVIQWAHQKDFCRITLLTDKISAESQRFFQNHGFVFSHMIPMRMMLQNAEGASLNLTQRVTVSARPPDLSGQG